VCVCVCVCFNLTPGAMCDMHMPRARYGL